MRSASRAATAASRRAAFAVAAFGRTRRRTGRAGGGSAVELVEARERLGVAVGVEPLDARHAGRRHRRSRARGSGLSKAPPPARSVPQFVRRTRSASGRRPRTSSMRSRDVVGELEQGADARRSDASAPRADREAERPVVDELDVGRERRAVAIRDRCPATASRPSAPSPRRGCARGRRAAARRSARRGGRWRRRGGRRRRPRPAGAVLCASTSSRGICSVS